MSDIVIVVLLVALLALWLLGIAPPYLFPAVAVIVAPGPVRRFLASTVRRLRKRS